MDVPTVVALVGGLGTALGVPMLREYLKSRKVRPAPGDRQAMLLAQHAYEIAEAVQKRPDPTLVIDQAVKEARRAGVEEAKKELVKELDQRIAELRAEFMRASWTSYNGDQYAQREIEALKARLHAIELASARLGGQLEGAGALDQPHPTPLPGAVRRR